MSKNKTILSQCLTFLVSNQFIFDKKTIKKFGWKKIFHGQGAGEGGSLGKPMSGLQIYLTHPPPFPVRKKIFFSTKLFYGFFVKNKLL